MKVLQNVQKFRVLWYGGAELTEVPGTGMNCPTELTEAPDTGNTRVNAHRLREGVRLEAEDLIQRAWMACSHWANVPEAICPSSLKGSMDYRQNHHRERR